MSQQPRPGAPTSNRVIWRRRCDDGVAGPAGELLADVPDHLEPARHVVERLGHLLANPAQRATAGGAGAGGRVPHFLARQMLGQRPSRRFLRRRRLDRRNSRRRRGRSLALVLLQRLDRQFELLGLASQLLRRAPELGPPVAGQLEFEFGNLSLCRRSVAASVGTIMSQAAKWTLSSDELAVPNYTGSFLKRAYLGVDAPGIVTGLTFGQAQLIAKKWQLAFVVGNDLLADANVNVADWLLALGGEAMANMIDYQGFVGGANTGDPFLGILNWPSTTTVDETGLKVTSYVLPTGSTTFAKFAGE